MTVSVDGEAIAFSLHESIDSVRHVLTPAEQKHPWSAPKWDYHLTGRLRLSIDNLRMPQGRYDGPGLMEKFSSSKTASETLWLGSR